MSKKKYQVFISSTYEDLQDERLAVMQTLLRNNCIPAAMELFNAANNSQWETIKKVIDESDYFIVIVAGKYGSIHPEQGISFTRMEYRYATQINKPILRFLYKNLGALPLNKTEENKEKKKKLEDFRKLLQLDNLCAYYEDSKDLASKVLSGLVQLKEDYPAAGWVTGVELADSLNSNKALKSIHFDEIKNQLEKTVIYKLIHFQHQEKPAQPIYERLIPRINERIEVSSEYVSIKVNKFDRPVEEFKSRDRTNGRAIEVDSLFPFKLRLEDGDRTATMIEPIISGPSNIYVTSRYVYNGFKPGNFDLGTKAEKHTELIRLVVDISSIPDFDKILSPPRLFFHCLRPGLDSGGVDDYVDIESSEYETVAPGIFLAQMKNVKKEESLRFLFALKDEI